MSWKRRSLAKGASDSGSMEPCTGVDALPDELLLLIFSKLQDGPTLLDTLPRVCRRWRRVARDPAAWAAVELTVKNNVADETRILLHAPAAKSLTLDPWQAGYPVPGHRVRSALHRTRLVVRRLAIWEWGRRREVKGLQEAVASFLLRQRDSLRDLHLQLCHHHDWSVAGTLHVIAQLHRLRSLHLDFLMTPEVKYNGELRGHLPGLLEISVNAFFTPGCNFADEAVPQGLVGDLVRGAPALRVLNLDMPVGADREACAALRAVERVRLNAFQNDVGYVRPEGEDAVGAVRTAFQLVDAMKTPALRMATVSLCHRGHPRYSLEVKGWCQAVLAEFALQSPNVAMALEIDGPECSKCLLRPEDCPGLAWFDYDDDIEDVVAENAVAEDVDAEDVVAEDVVAENAVAEDVAADGAVAEDDGDDSVSATYAEDYPASLEGVLDSEPEASFVAEPDDFCESDCSMCASQRASTPSEAATASEPEDPDMFYPNEL